MTPSDADYQRAVDLLIAGELVAFPTETVYGLGADAARPSAVAKIFAAKGRPADHPLIVHVAGHDAVDRWAEQVPDVAWELMEAFWPGPLTLILKKQAWVPDAVTGGQDTVGLFPATRSPSICCAALPVPRANMPASPRRPPTASDASVRPRPGMSPRNWAAGSR